MYQILKFPNQLILLTFYAFSVFPVSAGDTPVIAVASNAQFALQEIRKQFIEQTGQKVRLSFGSSGNFARQIIQGAPFELFIAADDRYVFELHKAALTVDQGVRYANGRLVLFIPENTSNEIVMQLPDLISQLADKKITKLAIANPEHAPYGRAAKQVLEHINLWDALQTKLVFGESIAQAAQFAMSGSVQAGLIAYSLAIQPAMHIKGQYVLIPESWHQPIHQRMVLLKPAGKTARTFYRYLQQAAAHKIFVNHGFLLPQ